MMDMRTTSAGGAALDRVTAFSLEREADAFPQSALDAAALLLLDTLGVAAAAAPMDAGRIARDAAAALYGAGEAGVTARMLFDGRPVSLAGAGYAAASQIDNLDAHDGYNPSNGHIGVAVIPALAALAEADADLSGREALATLVIGYEIAGRAGTALHASVEDYHTSGAWNGLGVAAMAARRRGLSADALRQALGIAEYHGPRSQMMREIDNPTMLHDGSGWGALVGLSAAILAEKGFTGAPAITIEADSAAPHWEDLGDHWQVERQYIKPYPICRWAHAAIDAARELQAEHQFAAADVASVRIGAYHEAARLYSGVPETTSQAQYSLPFAVATMLVHGEIGVSRITGAGLSDPAVADMIQRMEVVEEPRHEARRPAEFWSDATITLKDGRALSSGDTHATGGPERPWSREQALAKFYQYAGPALGRARAEALAEGVLGLAAPDARFSGVSALLYDPTRA